MGFLKSLRMKANLKKKEKDPYHNHNDYQDGLPSPPFSPPGKDLISELPPKVLQRIFRFVCPHAADESYASCEESPVEGACMLCDQRDLSNCVRVATRWRNPATTVLYNSLRIDPVHYCELEATLAEKRKRGTFFDRNHEGKDPATERLRLLCRTLRNDPARLGLLVQFLKLPYMVRETCKPDIARIVAVCPNLLYIDLPEGVFVDDQSCLALRAEVQARCPNLKKMAYLRGSERSLAGLSRGHTWPNLEVLDLNDLHIDVSTLRRVFGALPYLHTLKVSHMKDFTNHIFYNMGSSLPPFPALKELYLDETPGIDADGMTAYSKGTGMWSRLQILSLTATGVLPSKVHLILDQATCLQHLSIIEAVDQSMPADPIPLLSSDSLHTLHWEITAEGTTSFIGEDIILSGFYDYLRNSLLSQSLPNLTELYVRDPGFPETLLDLPPPRPMFAGGAISSNNKSTNPFAPSHRQTQSFNSRNPFNNPTTFNQNTPPASPPPNLGILQALTIYSKGLDEMEWNFSHVQPTLSKSGVGNRGSTISITPSRPISAYGMLAGDGMMGAAWNRGEARRSVMVGNGFGGFLAVPESEARPSSSYGEKRTKEKRSTRIDMWR